MERAAIINRHAMRNRIRSLAVIKGGLDEAAAVCAMPRRTLESYISGESLPGSVTLAQLARGFGVSADFILFGSERRDD